MGELLTYDLNDFMISVFICYYKEKADSEVVSMMPNTPLKELYNLWRYIQYHILESEYEYDDDEFDNPLNEDNWLLQTRGKYMKFVIYHSSNVTEPIQSFNQKMVSFRKGSKGEETAYLTLKDKIYFNGFSRSLYITAKSDICEEVLDSDNNLFEANQFCFL